MMTKYLVKFFSEMKKDWNGPINLFTEFRFFLGLIPGLLLIEYPQNNDIRLIATVLFAIVAIMDMDGFLARKLKKVTEFGKMLDPVVDAFFSFYTLAILCVVYRYDYVYLIFTLFVIVSGVIAGIFLYYVGNSGTDVSVNNSGKIKTALLSVTIGLMFLPIDRMHQPIVWFFMVLSSIAIIWSKYEYWRDYSGKCKMKD